VVGIGHDFVRVQRPQFFHQQVGMRVRHDIVDRRAQHIGRRLDLVRVLDRLKFMLQHILHRNRLEFALGDGEDGIVRRNQHDGIGVALHRHLHRHAGTETAAHHRHALRIDVMALAQPVVQHAAIVNEMFFRRIAMRIAVAAIVHRQHRHAGE
jgi:hypothetical protein